MKSIHGRASIDRTIRRFRVRTMTNIGLSTEHLVIARLTNFLRSWRLCRALHCTSRKSSAADLRYLDAGALANMKLPFALANTARRERALCRPFTTHVSDG